MKDISNVADEKICTQCGCQLAVPEQCLAMDGGHSLCMQCYRCMVIPGRNAGPMETLD